MNERYEKLRAFLAEGAATPFVWGQTDCSMWCASWIKAVHGVDPAASLRGTYATAEECAALIERHGGFVELVAGILKPLQLKPAVTVSPGDVAVVQTPIGPTMMISAGLSWAWKSEGGVFFSRRDPIQVWAV